ncbi:MFS transporter [Gulosibacter sp. 10]|uniref:MFS transporter n=1 Tax=Gulosibacter sp. 10 TaxID=1255570 RepID=UPI00097EBB6C|nr:Antiseptic resistance protein [Gulosibacter sp. 10]
MTDTTHTPRTGSTPAAAGDPARVAPGSRISPARAWAAMAVLSASLLVLMMDMTILNIALPEMAAELHPTSDQQLWIIDVYSLVLAGLLVSWAAIGDRWGRKRMLMLGYTIFAVSSILVLWADSAEMVIAIRAFLGVGGAMIMPTTLSLIRVVFTDAKKRALALSIWAAVSGIGTAIGPLVGGFLLEHFSWHAAFLINVPLMVIAVVAGIIILPESRVPNPGRWDALSAVLSLVGMTLLVWSIKQFGKQASFASLEGWIALAAAIAVLSWFAVRCVRSDHPLLELRLFRNRPFSAGILAALGSTFSMVAAMLLFAQWLQLVNGATPMEAGIQLIPVAIAGSICSLAAPSLARFFGARSVIAGGLVVSAVGMFMIGLVPGELTLTTVLIALAFVGAGTGSLAIGSAMIMLGSPEEKAGNAGALEETSYELGAVLGVAILGSISALMYRAELAGAAAFRDADAGVAEQARESLGAAVSVAQEHELPQLAHAAGEAFTHSLQATGLAGGVLLVAVGALVFLITPKGTDIAGASH